MFRVTHLEGHHECPCKPFTNTPEAREVPEEAERRRAVDSKRGKSSSRLAAWIDGWMEGGREGRGGWVGWM